MPPPGHGSGSGFAQNVPRQYQQQPQQKKRESPWSGNFPATTTAAPGIEHGNASSKAQLKAWWGHFNVVRAMKKEGNEYQAPDNTVPNGVVFGKPLKESVRHANVQISTADSTGELYVWGYIPVVVAKCGLYLKENATEVPGTFRVNGSTTRMRLLQEAFETPPRYGRNLDWKQESYTTHDVANVFRKYLTQMPEPVIPYDLYHQFRDTLVNASNNQEEAVAKFKSLIRQMPRANQYLLLYVLDLLSVFARKSDVNLMTATNLAVIFRRGLISHPNHEMSRQEHALSQKVLEFLIAQQDWFMLDLAPQATNATTASHGHERRPSADHDVMIIPGGVLQETEEFSAGPGGGWRLVSKTDQDAGGMEKARLKMMRRRTMERSDLQNQEDALDDEDIYAGGPSSPTPTAHSHHSSSGNGVKRSRTLPASQGRNDDGSKRLATPMTAAGELKSTRTREQQIEYHEELIEGDTPQDCESPPPGMMPSPPMSFESLAQTPTSFMGSLPGMDSPMMDRTRWTMASSNHEHVDSVGESPQPADVMYPPTMSLESLSDASRASLLSNMPIPFRSRASRLTDSPALSLVMGSPGMDSPMMDQGGVYRGYEERMVIR